MNTVVQMNEEHGEGPSLFNTLGPDLWMVEIHFAPPKSLEG